MAHVGLNQVPCRESTAQTELAGEDRCCNHASKLARIFTRAGRVCSSDTQKVEHSALRLEDGTTTDGTDLDRRHRHRDVEVAVHAGTRVSVDLVQTAELFKTYFFMTVIQLLLSTF